MVHILVLLVVVLTVTCRACLLQTDGVIMKNVGLTRVDVIASYGTVHPILTGGTWLSTDFISVLQIDSHVTVNRLSNTSASAPLRGVWMIACDLGISGGFCTLSNMWDRTQTVHVL